jgi:tripartite ATP-independent transporter DctP family solute receptor
MIITRRRLIRSTAASAPLLFAPALLRPARAAQRLAVASLLGPDKPETRIWHAIRESIEQEMPGQFAFNIVPNAALGAEKDVAEGIRLGSIQASLFTASALSAWVPEAQILDLPFLFQDRDHVARTVHGPTGTALGASFANQGFVAAAWVNYGARHLLAKQEITTPAALAGKRMRVIQSPLHTELWKAYGAVPAAIPITEAYNALSTGVVEAMDLTKAAYAGFKLYEVVPWLIETGHIWASGIVCFSGSFWNGLTVEQQALFARAADSAARQFNALIVEEESKAVGVAKAAGGHVVPVDRTPWQGGARKVWAILADRVGGMNAIERIHSARGL